MTTVNVLVTGSAGFIGHELVCRLRQDGHHVTGVDLEAETLSDLSVRHDLTTPLRLPGPSPAVCVHLASAVGGIVYNTEHQETLEVNALIDAHTMAACADAGCRRMVFFSSINVFERTPSFAHGPLATLDQVTPYARSKAVAEKRFAAGFENLTVLRPTNAFGQNQGRRHRQYGQSHVIPDLLRKIDTEPVLEILGDGSQVRNFVHVSDLCGFVAKNLQSTGHVYLNLRSDITISIRDLALQLMQSRGRELPIRYLPACMRYESFQITDFDLSVPAAYGWAPAVRAIGDGLRK